LIFGNSTLPSRCIKVFVGGEILISSILESRTKRGKTPLEKVYEKIPQAVNILLEEAVKNSGYVEHINSVNMKAQLDFG